MSSSENCHPIQELATFQSETRVKPQAKASLPPRALGKIRVFDFAYNTRSYLRTSIKDILSKSCKWPENKSDLRQSLLKRATASCQIPRLVSSKKQVEHKMTWHRYAAHAPFADASSSSYSHAIRFLMATTFALWREKYMADETPPPSPSKKDKKGWNLTRK